MKRTTIGLILATVTLFAGRTRPFQPPQYRLQAGVRLFYTTRSDAQPPRPAQRWQVWVVAVNPDSGIRLLVKRTQVRTRTDSAGRTTEDEWRSDWSRCTLYPDGRIPPTGSLDQADLRTLFPPLPADTGAARAGWFRYDSVMSETETYLPENKNLTDSLWLIQFTHTTPLDEIYLLSTTGRYGFDTRRGLLLSKETESVRGWGSGAGTTRRATTLDSTIKAGKVALGAFAAQMDVWFASDSACSSLLDRAGESHGALDVLLDSAQMVMDSGRARVTDAVVRTLFDDEAATLKGIAAELREDALRRDSIIGSPAPDWKLPDAAGKMHSLKDYRGRVVVLDFCYRGCPWCIRAMPTLNAVAAQFGPGVLAVIGMNTDKELSDIQFVTEKLGLTYTMLRCGDVYEKYRVSGFPTLFVLDGRGRIRDMHVGYSPDMKQKLERAIRNAIGED
jgi:peroxiredoxin